MLLYHVLISALTKLKADSHHNDFNPLGHRIGFVVLFFSQYPGKVAQLPDRTTLTTLPGELYTQTCTSANTNSPSHARTHIHNLLDIFFIIITYDSYLQDQGDTCREESHEDKVIGQDRHTAKTTHYL